MKRKIFSVLFALVLVLSLGLVMAAPAAAQVALHVDDDGAQLPGAYTTITAALGVATGGETIIVHKGSYPGFDANVSGITVKAKKGAVINGAGISHGAQVVGVLVTADDVTIQGLTVTGSYSTSIWVKAGADRAQILKNKVSGSSMVGGIVLDGATETTVKKNDVKGAVYGIHLKNGASKNLIEDNKITSSTDAGILLDGKLDAGIPVKYNVVHKNKVEYGYRGIYLRNADFNTLGENHVKKNSGPGIVVTGPGWGYSDGNVLFLNKVEQNTQHGISLGLESGTQVLFNTAKNNGDGTIYFDFSYTMAPPTIRGGNEFGTKKP